MTILPRSDELTGSQKPYPYAAGSLENAGSPLRPGRQPLYDTVAFGSAHEFKNTIMMFGSSAVDSPTIHSNMERACSLPTPLEFSLFGFSVFFHSMEKLPIQSFSEHTLFTFLHSGSRHFLEVPLCVLPNGTDWHQPTQKVLVGTKKDEPDLDDAVSWIQNAPLNPEEYSDTQHKNEAQQIKQQIQDERIYDFTIGEAALRIRPGDSFKVELRFNERLTLGSPVKMTVFLHGLMWKPV